MQNSKCNMQTLKGRPLTLFAFCILHFALLMSLTACGARAKAQTLPDGPPLAVPIAPAHEIVIEQIAEAPPQEPEPAPAPVPPTPKPAVTIQIRPPAPKPETPANNLPAVAPPPGNEAPVRASPAPSAGDEKKARDFINRANSDLMNRVDYQKLSDEGKRQYNQSKRFVVEAEQAIKDKNLVLAVTLAEKAATLAAELVR